MNKTRRAEIEVIKGKLESLAQEIKDLKTEEEEYRDNMPESLQGGNKWDMADEACAHLDAASEGLSDALNALEEAAQ